jgi:hypothetical protein
LLRITWVNTESLTGSSSSFRNYDIAGIFLFLKKKHIQTYLTISSVVGKIMRIKNKNGENHDYFEIMKKQKRHG